MISSISSTSSSSQSALIEQMRQRMFSRIDTNGDGKHDKDELAAMVANGPQGGTSVDDILSSFDTDGDGAISEAEFEAAAPPDGGGQPPMMGGMAGMSGMSSSDFLAQMFSRIDTNGDGKHDKDELAAMVANGPEGGPSVDDILSKFDTDGDGTVSEAEYEAGMQDGGMGAAQADNSGDTLFDTLLEALEEEKDSTTATAGASTTSEGTSTSEMLAAALRAYMQLSSSGLALTEAQSLLGSTLIV